MPLHTTTDFLTRCIRPGLKLREENECHITVNPESIQLQTRTSTKNEYFSQTISVAQTDALTYDIAGSDTFWCNIGQIKDFLWVTESDGLTVEVPCETSQGRLWFHTPHFLYRFAPVDPDYAFQIPDVSRPEGGSSFVVPNATVHYAVTVADLAGETLQVRVHPDSQVVEFSADRSDACSDAFRYPLGSDTIDAIEGHPSHLTVSLGVLPDFVKTIPPTTPVSIRILDDRLIYRTAYPTDGAEVRLDIAAREKDEL